MGEDAVDGSILGEIFKGSPGPCSQNDQICATFRGFGEDFD